MFRDSSAFSGFSVDRPTAAGVTFEQGPLIAWFRDPAGTFLSVVEV